MFGNEISKPKHLQFLQTQISLLNNISSIIKTTQNSILSLSSSSVNKQTQQSDRIHNSLFNMNNSLNELLAQVMKENNHLVTKYSALSNQFDSQIMTKLYSSLQKSQSINFILENKITQMRNTSTRIEELLSINNDNDNKERIKEMLLMNSNKRQVNSLLEKEINMTSDKLGILCKKGNEYSNRTKLLEEQIEKLKEGIRIVENEGVDSVTIVFGNNVNNGNNNNNNHNEDKDNRDNDSEDQVTEKEIIQLNDEDSLNEGNQVFNFELDSPEKNRSYSLSISLSLDDISNKHADDDDDKVIVKKTHQTQSFFIRKPSKVIPKLNFHNINKHNTMSFKKLDISKGINNEINNTILQLEIIKLKRENEKYSRLSDSFKSWLKNVPSYIKEKLY